MRVSKSIGNFKIDATSGGDLFEQEQKVTETHADGCRQDCDDMSDAIVVRTRLETSTMLGSVVGGIGMANSPLTGSPIAGSPQNVTQESKLSPPMKHNVARFGVRNSAAI